MTQQRMGYLLPLPLLTGVLATTGTDILVMIQCRGANNRLDVHLLHTESDLLWLPVRFSTGAPSGNAPSF